MTLVSEKPCWEIMRCSGGDCVARRDPDKPCWEHAEALNYTVSVHGVCADCIVYVAKQAPAVFSDKELIRIFAHHKVYGLNQPKCPAQMTRGRLWPIASERRKTARYRIKVQASAVIANLDRSVGQVLDLSYKGLAFSHTEQGVWLNQPIQMAINGEDFSLSGLPAQIILDRPLPDSSKEQWRCGVRFTSLSLLQKDMLESIIRQYGQAYYDGAFCC